MKVIKLSMALLCAVMTTGAFAQTATDVANKYNEAGEMLGQKNYSGAITALESTIEMGIAAGGDALETVQSAQKLLPQCYYSNAMAAASQKNFDSALTDFTKAAELGELYGNIDIMSKANTMMGKVYMAQGGVAVNSQDWASAIEIFGKGYEALPSDTSLGLWLGKSYAENGQMEEATEVYGSIIALEAKNSRYATVAAQAKGELATYMLIQAQEQAAANDFDGFTATTDSILEFDPTNASTHMMRLQTATNMQNFDAVIGFGEEAAEVQPDEESQSNAYFLIGAAYQNKENSAKAIEIYKKVTAGANVDTAKAQITALSK